MTNYQFPPQPIQHLVDTMPTPGVSVHPDGQLMLLIFQTGLPSIEEVARPELRLAGHRINPETNGPSRAVYANKLELWHIDGKKTYPITGLPDFPKLNNLAWSPDGNYLCFTQTTAQGIELWIIENKTARAKKLTEGILNNSFSGLPYQWSPDSKRIIYKAVPENRKNAPEKNARPNGPVVRENKGVPGPMQTYQDLLKSPYDEALFDYYMTSSLIEINIHSLAEKALISPKIINQFNYAPDGQYLLISTIQKPYSYNVHSNRFPIDIHVFDQSGKLVKTIDSIPLAEDIPLGFGAVRKGKRRFQWRPDKPATLYWVEAQDNGDPKQKVHFRDIIYALKAPFKAAKKELLKLQLRLDSVEWSTDQLAIVHQWWWPQRQLITSRFSPGTPENPATVLFDRSWEDSYNDPGNFQLTRNHFGRSVLLTNKNKNCIYLVGNGATPEGKQPFLDKYDLNKQSTARLWQSEAPYFEIPVKILNEETSEIITRRESKKEQPNYFIRNLQTGTLAQSTFFESPYKAIEKIQKRNIRYKRADGVQLNGSLYLPQGYDPETDGTLPVLMWAYPREFKSADAAGQNKKSPYEFFRVGWHAPLLWATIGYAVLDDFSMPIVGEADQEPNESFIEQLKAGAEAAIWELEKKGIAQRGNIAVGGHSYGAFMTANLLAHTDLFAAGIARSGAYNRTLTPFGFQSEQRSFWEASETYFKMSPFMHADKIDAPLLLIHGEADNNSGTYPMQSERFFKALKGHGAHTRLVLLPHESHSYQARESVMHVLWETSEWLKVHLKVPEQFPTAST